MAKLTQALRDRIRSQIYKSSVMVGDPTTEALEWLVDQALPSKIEKVEIWEQHMTSNGWLDMRVQLRKTDGTLMLLKTTIKPNESNK